MNRPNETFEGAVRMASYVLLVGDIKNPGKSVSSVPENKNVESFKILRIIHVRDNWTDAQKKMLSVRLKKDKNGVLRTVPAPEILVGQRINVRIPKHSPKGQELILLISSYNKDTTGVFSSDQDWPVVSTTKESSILKILSIDKI